MPPRIRGWGALMPDRHHRTLRLFGKEAYQSPLFARKCKSLGEGVDEEIVAVTTAHYTLFRKLKHGLVLGQLSQDLPHGYRGPNLQFIYKVLAGKIFFADLQVGGFSEIEIKAIEACYDL